MDNKNIEKLLADFQSRHSDFQIENFFIRNKGDDWNKYKSCLKEIAPRYDQVRNNEFKIAELKKHKKSIHFLIKKIIHRIFLNSKSLSTRIENDILNAEKENGQRKAELELFFKHAVELKKRIGNIDSKKRAALEAEAWRVNALRLAAKEILCTGRISIQTIELILSLPDQDSRAILSIILPDKVEIKNLIEYASTKNGSLLK